MKHDMATVDHTHYNFNTDPTWKNVPRPTNRHHGAPQRRSTWTCHQISLLQLAPLSSSLSWWRCCIWATILLCQNCSRRAIQLSQVLSQAHSLCQSCQLQSNWKQHYQNSRHHHRSIHKPFVFYFIWSASTLLYHQGRSANSHIAGNKRHSEEKLFLFLLRTSFKQYYFVLQSRREKSSWPQTDIGPVLFLKYCDRFHRIGWIGRMDSAFENAPQCQGHKEFLLEPEHPLCVCVCARIVMQ